MILGKAKRERRALGLPAFDEEGGMDLLEQSAALRELDDFKRQIMLRPGDEAAAVSVVVCVCVCVCVCVLVVLLVVVVVGVGVGLGGGGRDGTEGHT